MTIPSTQPSPGAQKVLCWGPRTGSPWCLPELGQLAPYCGHAAGLLSAVLLCHTGDALAPLGGNTVLCPPPKWWDVYLRLWARPLSWALGLCCLLCSEVLKFGLFLRCRHGCMNARPENGVTSCVLRTALLRAQGLWTGSSLRTPLSPRKIHSLPAGPFVHIPDGLPAEWPLRSFTMPR